MRIRRRVRAIDSSNQVDLFSAELDSARHAPAKATHATKPGGASFNRPDPRDIRLGEVRLDEHLEAMGTDDALRMRELLDAQDWSVFEQQYKPGGRPPYAPQAMLGLILYGIVKGVSSLRGLEELARLDLGAMWITGGLCPDHASLGRFVQLHDGQITGEFLTELTGAVLKATHSGVETVAGDGTVVQAAASRYHTIKLEAAREAAGEAQREAQAHGEDAERSARAARAEEVKETLERRVAARRAKGKAVEGMKISPTEPEAVIQPLKDKTRAPSYKPNILANEQRVILAWDLDPSSETAGVGTLLDQARSLGEVKTALFDAGYHCETVIEASDTRQIELLCPEGRALGKEDWTRQSKKQYPKSQFTYDIESDTYTCPAGERLHRIESWQGKTTDERYTRYTTTVCSECAQRSQCTKNQRGRRITRYPIDTAKEALRQSMSEAPNRERYRQRQAMVEPVFSVLKLKQGLTRFRRRGFAGARREFALHVMAYNLSRVLVRKPLRGHFSSLWCLVQRRCRQWLAHSALGWHLPLLQRSTMRC